MPIQDTLSYILFTNPISSTAGSFAKSAASAAVYYSGLSPRVEYQMPPPQPLWKLAAASGPWVRLGALSGSVAIILGAVASHKPNAFNTTEEKQLFETANHYHFVHALAMMGLPFCRFPPLAASFMITGTALFCGTCYYSAFTGNRKFSKFTPIGGTCLILGWLTMCI